MLNQFVAVYVPGTNGLPGTEKSELDPDTQKGWARETARRLAAKFGGATTTPATGYYVADNGILVEETILIVKSFHDHVTDALEFSRGIAQWLKDELHQEAISLETESGLDFI